MQRPTGRAGPTPGASIWTVSRERDPPAANLSMVEAADRGALLEAAPAEPTSGELTLRTWPLRADIAERSARIATLTAGRDALAAQIRAEEIAERARRTYAETAADDVEAGR